MPARVIIETWDHPAGDEPDYPSPYVANPQTGDMVLVSGYAYTNESGGTALHKGTAKVKLTKGWWDYETGWRYHGRCADRPGTTVYVSQFDVLNKVPTHWMTTHRRQKRAEQPPSSPS